MSIRQVCPRCSVKMTIGQYLLPYTSSSPDFIGDRENEFSPGQTVAIAAGPAVLNNCWKCPLCGFSMTITPSPEYIGGGLASGDK
jgi:hypothetical protein